MEKKKTFVELYHNKWLSLRQIDNFVYSHESRCNGNIVAILPFTRENNIVNFLLRKETNPAWDQENQILTCITGGLDEGNTPLEMIIEELDEEGGYTAEPENIISLATIRGVKSVDSVYHLFTVDLTGFERHEAMGDGSELEKGSSCYWSRTIGKAQDPLVYTMYYRMLHLIHPSSLATDLADDSL